MDTVTETWQFWFATIVFVGTYILIATEVVNKTTAALVGGGLMMIFILHGPSHAPAAKPAHASVVGSVQNDPAGHRQAVGQDNAAVQDMDKLMERKPEPYDKLDIFAKYVNFNVLFTLVGMMILVNILSGTGLFQYVAIKCAKYARGSPMRTLIFLVSATAILSAFLDNVTTVLLVVPVTLLVASELGVSAMPFLMAEIFSSNMGGSATLIGDPPMLIIGTVAHFDFMAFIINLSPFIIIITALYCMVLWWYYRKRMTVTVERRARIMELDEDAAITDHANLRRGGIVMLLTLGGFLVHGALDLQPCVVAMSGAALAMLVCKIDVDHVVEKVEWSTIFFFMGLFVVVSGAENVGLMEELGKLLRLTDNWHPLLTVLLVMWVSGVCAAVMNSVSYAAAVVTIIAAFMAQAPGFRESLPLQHLMWWGLGLAVCLGANATVVGAAANMVVVGLAEKAGQPVSFRKFLVYGMPVTIGCMVASSIYAVVWYYLMVK